MSSENVWNSIDFDIITSNSVGHATNPQTKPKKSKIPIRIKHPTAKENESMKLETEIDVLNLSLVDGVMEEPISILGEHILEAPEEFRSPNETDDEPGSIISRGPSVPERERSDRDQENIPEVDTCGRVEEADSNKHREKQADAIIGVQGEKFTADKTIEFNQYAGDATNTADSWNGDRADVEVGSIGTHVGTASKSTTPACSDTLSSYGACSGQSRLDSFDALVLEVRDGLEIALGEGAQDKASGKHCVCVTLDGVSDMNNVCGCGTLNELGEPVSVSNNGASGVREETTTLGASIEFGVANCASAPGCSRVSDAPAYATLRVEESNSCTSFNNSSESDRNGVGSECAPGENIKDRVPAIFQTIRDIQKHTEYTPSELSLEFIAARQELLLLKEETDQLNSTSVDHEDENLLSSKDLNKRTVDSRLKHLEEKLKAAGITDEQQLNISLPPAISCTYRKYSDKKQVVDKFYDYDANQNLVSDQIGAAGEIHCEFDVNKIGSYAACSGGDGYFFIYDELEDEEDESLTIMRSESNMGTDGERKQHNPDREHLKSLLKKPGRGKDKKNRVVFNENRNEFFDADYIILIREDCDYDEEEDDGICTCNQHEMVRLTCCEPNCNCNVYEGYDQTPQSPKFAPPLEFVDAVTLSPPEGYKDMELGEQQLLALQQMARRGQMAAVCRECSQTHDDEEHKYDEKSIQTNHVTIVNDKMDVDQDSDVLIKDKVTKNKNVSNTTSSESNCCLCTGNHSTGSGKFKQNDKQYDIPDDNASNISKNISSSDNSTCSSRSNISNNCDNMENDYEMGTVNKKRKKNVTSGKVKQIDRQCSKPDDNACDISKNIHDHKDDPTSSSDNSTLSSCSNISNDCDNMDNDYEMGIVTEKRKKNATSGKVIQVDKQCNKPDDYACNISKNKDNSKGDPTSSSDNSTHSSCINMDNDYEMGIINKKGKNNATSGKVKQIEAQCSKPDNTCDISKNIDNVKDVGTSSSDNSTRSSCSNICNDCVNMDNDYEMSIVNKKGKKNVDGSDEEPASDQEIEKEKTDQSQQTTPTTPPVESVEPKHNHCVSESVTTATDRRQIKEMEEERRESTESPTPSIPPGGSPISGILKGGRLWKQQSMDINSIRAPEPPQQELEINITSDDEGSGKRSVRFTESQEGERDVCDGAPEKPSVETTPEEIKEVIAPSPEPTEMTLTFKLGNHVLVSNNSLKPNSAVRQLFPCTKPLNTTTKPAEGDETGHQYLVTAESLRAFEEAKRAKLPQIIQSGEADESIKKAIERNTLRRSLIRYEPRSKKNQQKTDNSLVERIKQLTCDVDEPVEEEQARASPPGEEARNSPETLQVKNHDKSFSPSSSSSSNSSVSSTYKKITDLFAKRDRPDIQLMEPTKPLAAAPDLGGPQEFIEAHNPVVKVNSTTETRKQFLSTLAPLTACVSGTVHPEDYYYHANNPGDRMSMASSVGTEYSLEDIEEGLRKDEEESKRIAPDVLAGTPSASESGDELAMFVQQDASRIERIKKKYQADDEDDEHDDYGFNRRPSVRGIKPRFGSTTEILQQIQNQMQPPNNTPPRNPPVAWPYYSETNLSGVDNKKNINQPPNYQYAQQYRPTTLVEENIYQNCANQRCAQVTYRSNMNVYASPVVRVGGGCNEYYQSLPRTPTRNGRPQSPPPQEVSKGYQTMVYIPYNHIEGYQPPGPYYVDTRVTNQNQINKRYIDSAYQEYYATKQVRPPYNMVSRSESPLPGQFSTARSTQTPAPTVSTCTYYPRYRQPPPPNGVVYGDGTYATKLNRHSFPSGTSRYPTPDNVSLTDSDSQHSSQLHNGYRDSMPNSPTKPRFIERGVPEGAASVSPQDSNSAQSASTMTSPTSPQNPQGNPKPLFYAMNV